MQNRVFNTDNANLMGFGMTCSIFRNAGLLFLVVMKRKTYDQSFENELTRLDLNVAQEDGFSKIALSVQVLPNCNKENYESFCSSEGTLEYKGLNAKRS